MTRDKVIALARKAGIKNDCDGVWCTADQLERFAALVAAAEREACAKVCEEIDDNPHVTLHVGTVCAANIRARNNERTP